MLRHPFWQSRLCLFVYHFPWNWNVTSFHPTLCKNLQYFIRLHFYTACSKKKKKKKKNRKKTFQTSNSLHSYRWAREVSDSLIKKKPNKKQTKKPQPSLQCMHVFISAKLFHGLHSCVHLQGILIPFQDSSGYPARCLVLQSQCRDWSAWCQKTDWVR